MGVTRQATRHLLVTLQTGLIGIHSRRELIAPRPCVERDPGRRFRMHLVTGDAGKISAFETGRLLHAVRLAPGHSNHPVSPEAVAKKIRLRSPDEILLRGMILFVRLDHEPLHQVLFSRTELPAVPVPIDLRRPSR